MNIVILGAGTVGYAISSLLCERNHNVTVVDCDSEKLSMIDGELDVRVIRGSASEASILFQAGVGGADICLAVTGSDEVNIVAASMARQMGSKRTISRIYSPIFRDLSTFDYRKHFGIDQILSLEHLTGMELAREIRTPGSVILENFARGELEIQEVVVTEKSKVAGTSLRELSLPADVRIGSIFREGQMWIPKASNVLQVNDRLGIVGKPVDVDKIKGQFQKRSMPQLRVMIAGGGESGYQLAQILQDDRYKVTLLEKNEERCKHLSKSLPHAAVLNGDATRQQVMEEERVADADYFVACTGDDEDNIMAGLAAKELGAKKILAIVGRPDYANILGKIGIDRAVSQREVMSKQILGYLNTGAVISKMPLPGGKVEIIEMEVLDGVPATRQALSELQLPPASLIAAVSRQDFVTVPGAATQLEQGDTVIVFAEKQVVNETIKFFRP